MSLASFHPAVADWFVSEFGSATDCQQAAWPEIFAGRSTLIAAPTGSGKTLAAFLSAINDLVLKSLQHSLLDETYVLYVSPLRALSNDVHLNLERPLQGIAAGLCARSPDIAAIRTAVRTGDTSSAERAKMRKTPPHILVTTPESLYVLLTSASGRAALRTVRTVIVDEIHSLLGNKRGAHLALSLERLSRLTSVEPVRIGLSATQKPIEAVADYLVGNSPSRAKPAIIDLGHRRQWDLQLETPSQPLGAVLDGDASAEIYDRITRLIDEHRSTIVFVNTRRMAERVSRALAERIDGEGETRITARAASVLAHHGSLAKEVRLNAERRLKGGSVKALVATASLELGIDVGEIDLVVQLGTTRSLATLLQRVGRSGHQLDRVPKGRIFPQTRDQLVESLALLKMARDGELDAIEPCCAPLDVLAQQITAECAMEEYRIADLYQLVCQAASYRGLTRTQFDDVVAMLADGFATDRGRRGAYVHLDRINQRIKGRRQARLVALTSGGAIPDQADYDVVLEPSGQIIGTVNEDFAIESLPGNIFQLGSNSWRILKIETQAVRVEDAEGAPPNIPFWFGEAPGRSNELCAAVAGVRNDIQRALEAGKSSKEITEELAHAFGVRPDITRQAVEYLVASYAMLGTLPTLKHLVLERFFDESGGMQLIVHSPYGARVNRAWGLALRKRFCRSFNFELQAAATDDAIVISLGVVHSFELNEVWSYLNADSVREVLIQALLDAPMFPIRWRWVASCSLALPRFRGGKKVPAFLQRMGAEDLIALVFPDQLACQENITGYREVPSHPLVDQVLSDCLTEVMDLAALERILRSLAANEIAVSNCDLPEPSPLAQEILNANPYAFLDDAPLEERRTRAVQSRRWLDPKQAQALGKLDPEAVRRVVEELRIVPRDADELHDAMLIAAIVFPSELEGEPADVPSREAQRSLTWRSHALGLFDDLRRAGRARPVFPDDPASPWYAAERAAEFAAVYEHLSPSPNANPDAASAATAMNREAALDAIVKSRLEVCGPRTVFELARELRIPDTGIEQSLVRIEASGFALRGSFRSTASETEWCERRILARMNKSTVSQLRREVEAVPLSVFGRFLLHWQYLTEESQLLGANSVDAALERLSGYAAPAIAWEDELLRRRIKDYSPDALDAATLSGQTVWFRESRIEDDEAATRMIGASQVQLVPRVWARSWCAEIDTTVMEQADQADPSQRVRRFLAERGPSFASDLLTLGLTKQEVVAGLMQLVADGHGHADGVAGLRAVIRYGNTVRRSENVEAIFHDVSRAGRWALLSDSVARLPVYDEYHDLSNAGEVPQQAEQLAHQLLLRYGVVFRGIVVRESLPLSWREILRALRRMELAGDVRGGRFVATVSGEQYALPEAVAGLRAARRTPSTREYVAVSAVDPVARVGQLTTEVRVPALSSNRILFCDGVPVATKIGKDIRFFKSIESADTVRVRNLLLSESATHHGSRVHSSNPGRLRRPRAHRGSRRVYSRR